MPYSIRLPDGTLVRNIPDDLPPEEAKQRIIAAGLVKAPAPAESTIMGELVRGGKQLASSVRTGIESVTSPEEAALAGVERGKKISEEAGEGPSFAAVKKAYEERGLLPAAGEAISQIPRALAGQGAQLAAMAGGARLGATAGSALGSVVPGVGTVVGGIAGGVLGAGATLLPQFMGANVERQAQEQLERGESVSIDRTKAYGAAAGQAALEGAGTAFTLGKRVVKGILGIADDAALATAKAQQELAKTAARSVAASAGRGAVRGTAEMPVEVAQAVLERAQAGLDLMSPEAFEEYGENAYLAGLVGPTIGGAAGVVERRAARAAQPAPGAPPGEAPIERAERLAAEKAAAEKAAAPPPALTTPPAPPVAETPAPPPVGEAPTPPVPPEGQTPVAPPVAETPATTEAAATTEAPTTTTTEAAPPIEEPKVRKSGEPPAGGMQPADIEALGISKKQPIYRRMLGKDLENPEQRTAVLEDIENYLTRGNGSEESRTKLAEFKAKFAPPPAVETTTTTPAITEAPPAPPPVVEAAAPAVPPAEPAVKAPVGGAPAIETAPTTPPVVEAPSVPSVSTEPEAGGAGAPVVSQPSAGTAPEGVGAVEPTGVVRPVADVAQPAGRERAAPAAVTPAPAPKPAALPEFTEADVDRAVETGLLTEEQAEVYRAELREEEAPPTAMGAAFQKQIDDIEAQMNALRQKNGRPPAKKTPAGAKFEALKAQLESLQTKETGDLAERLEKMGASGVVGTRGERPVIDLDAVQENLIKARAAPKMYQAVLNYIGVDADGNFLPTTYSREDAAEMAGLGRGSGANVTRVAQSMGITADVVSRFHAGQTDIIVLGKNVSEAGTGATDLQPTRGVLYEEPKKNQPGKAAGFLRDALTPDGKLDFSKLPLNSKKATKDSPAVTGLAEIYARASNYDPGRGDNLEVIKKLNAEIDTRTKTDRRGMQAALDRAYRVVRAEEEITAEQEAIAPETVAPDQVVTEEEAFEEPEFADATRRLSDEDVEYRTIPQSPVVTNRASHAELEKVVTDIGKMLGGKVAVTILDDVTDVDAKQKPGSRAGATIKGGIYLFRSGIAKGIEGQKTIFHELFHKGLKNLLPEAEYRAAMNRFYSQSAEIRAMADAYLASDVGKQDTKNLSPQDARMLAVEESLAEVAEQTDLKPTMVRQVGNFLARVADRLGMPQLARAIRTMGLNEQEKFIRDALQAGMGPSKAGEGAARFRSITPQTEAAVQGVDVIGEKERQTLTDRIKTDLAGNPALKLRVKFTDSLAAMEDFFTNAYAGQVRTAKGRLNPMVLISRALDASRVSKAAQEQGGLGFDSGLIVATELKNAEGQNISYQGVMGRIAEAAKDRGETYEQFRTKVDTVLYGHREYNLREKNKTLAPDEQVELLLSDAEIDKLEAAFQKDDFIKGVSSDLDTIRFNMLDTLVKAGRISEEQAQDYKDAIGYIPFSRIGEYENAWANATRGANRGVAALKNIRKLEGSEERKTTSVTENFSQLMDWGTKEAMKNDAGLRALKDMVLMGAAFKRPNKPKTDSPGGMVTVFDGGKAVSYYVPDPAHLVTFSIADPQLSNVLKAFQRGSQVLRAGVTSLPPFAIKQVFDDIVRAYTYAGVKNNAALVKSVMLNFPKNWVNEIFKKKPADIKALEGLGIVGTFDFTQQGNLKNILEEAGAKKETLGSSIMRVMEAGAKASDLAVRQAIYNQVMKETGDKAQAESAAREIINFSRRGSSKIMGQMISIIPFFNAYARGMDKLATTAAGGVVGQTTGAARSMFYKRMGVLTTMGLAYALMMQDDDDYQNLPDHVRDTNWVLPHGKELGFTPVIPIPAELAFFFKAIPERIVRYYKLHGTQEEQAAIDVLGNLTSRGIDVFSSPNITPQVLRPFLENIANYSFFLGRPLESQAQQALRPFERYGTGTSDAMKAVAKGLEDVANATGIEAFAVSPIKLENAIRGIFGTAAGLGLSMADMMVNPGRTDRPLHQQLGSQLTGLSAVTKDPIGSRNLDFIYDLEKRVEQVNGTVNRLMERKPEDVDQFIKDNIGLYSIRSSVQAVMSNIRVLNQAAMAIDRDKSLSPEERRKQIDQLRIDQNALAQQAMMLRKMARDIQMGR